MKEKSRIFLIVFLLITVWISSANAQIDVSLPNLTVSVGDTFYFNITIDDITGEGVTNWGGDISCDTEIVKFLDIENENTISEPLTVGLSELNETTYRLGAFGSSEIEGDGVLVKVKATLLQDSTSNLHWENFNLNGGDVASNPIDGSIAAITNQPPVMESSTLDTVVYENTTLLYAFSASDAENDSLKYSLIDSPGGAEIDSLTGDFSWPIGYEQSGNYEFYLGVTDNNTLIKDTIYVEVLDSNRAPIFTSTPDDTTIYVDSTYSFTYAGDDLDGDEYAFSLKTAYPGLTLFSSGQFAWTPNSSQVGEKEVIVEISDNVNSSFDTTLFTIKSTNAAPFFTQVLPDTIIHELETLSYQYIATDENDDELTYSLISSINGMTVSNTGLVEWTPTYEQEGHYELILMVTDSEYSVYDTAAVAVKNNNRLPEAFSLLLPENETVFEIDTSNVSDSLEFQWEETTDPDGENVTYTLLFYTETDTLIGKSLSETSVKFSNKDLHDQATALGLEQIAGEWCVLAADSTAFTKSNVHSLTIEKGYVSIDQEATLCEKYTLNQNYPNPFNPTTSIRYGLPEKSDVTITIYNMLGNKIQTLVNKTQNQGIYQLQWNATDKPSGIYILHIVANTKSGDQTFSDTKKMMLLK